MTSPTTQSLIGPVTLTVRDLAACTAYYTDSIGLKVHRREGNTAYLGADADDLLILHEDPTAPIMGRSPGLYHVAFLVPSRVALARQLRHFAEAGVLIDGMSDHAVSEALYLSDPEGNGIEVYRDRPREEWTWKDGFVHMVTQPLDAEEMLDQSTREKLTWNGIDPGTVVGHIHLRVVNIAEVEQFYCGILGFTVTTRAYRGALFVSKNGYHHHIGLNTWESGGAPLPPDDPAGLKQFVHRVSAEDLDAIRARATAAGVAIKETAQGILLRDPSGNHVEVMRGNGE